MREIMKRKFAFYGLLIVLMIGALCLAGCGSGPGTVEGTVIDASDGTPIADAEVIVLDLKRYEAVGDMNVFQKGTAIQKVLTDENGAYSVSLDPNSYVIQVWLEDVEVADRMVEVKPGRATTIDFSVTP
jgi:hypothetical protein